MFAGASARSDRAYKTFRTGAESDTRATPVLKAEPLGLHGAVLVVMTRRGGTTGRRPGSRGRRRSQHTPRPMTLVWITVVRGVMAIVLGLALAFHHNRAPAALANFMGIYWILNGMVTVQWGLAAEGARRRVPLVAGAIGVVTGAVVLLADVGTTFLLSILGFVIMLTGIVHLLGGFELADRSGRQWRPGVPLGILEVGMGATLILTSGQTGSLSTWLASAWALLGGVVLVSDALLIRRGLLATPNDPDLGLPGPGGRAQARGRGTRPKRGGPNTS
jgi:uncharacterized membrane protein HdeD (DUF308 family)